MKRMVVVLLLVLLGTLLREPQKETSHIKGLVNPAHVANRAPT
jgi:hypothetical protein